MFPASLHHIHRQEHFCKYVLASRMGVIMEKPPNMAPTWLPKRSQNDLKIDAKIHQNYDGFRDRFLKDFSGFLAPKWSQVGTKIDQKSMPIAKCDFLKNRALAAAGALFLRSWGSKLGIKID